MRVPVMIGAVLALAVFGGCGGGGGAPTATPGAQAIACNATGTGTAVAIADFSFIPASVTVAVNSFVNWTNNDGTSHTVTFDSGPNCGTLGGSATQTAQFTVAGTYPYHCNIHASMRGTVIVQ